MPPERLPLAGLRVVEFCQVASGPYCGMLLADLGAEVVKVEPPSGDAMRTWPPLSDGFSENFASLNRNKRSIALDLKSEGDVAIAKRLIDRSDILIENNRPGVMSRLGLGYTELSRARPELIYCSISAFGQTGPRSADAGFDVTVQAVSGMMSVTGESTDAPVKAGVPISDFASGLYGVCGVLALVNRVKSGGPGGHVDVPMLGVSLAIAALQTSEYFGTGKDPEPLGSRHPRNSPYQAYLAQDDYFVLAAGNDRLWRKVCDVIGRPELADDPAYGTTTDRSKNQVALTAELAPIFLAQKASHWIARFRGQGVPCEPINRYSDALAQPQVDSMGWVAPLELPNGHRTKTFGSPVSFTAPDGCQSEQVLRSPPALDADRTTILAELESTAEFPSALGASLPRFLRSMTELVTQAPSERELLPRCQTLLSQLIEDDGWLPEPFSRPNPERYCQNLLYCDPAERFCVVSFVWLPGQVTPIHDHRVWGVIGVLRGEERNERFRRLPGTGLEVVGVDTLVVGDLEVVSPRLGDIHRVSNVGSQTAVSIHVYGANIGTVERRIYDPDTGAVEPFISGYSNDTLPNFWGV